MPAVLNARHSNRPPAEQLEGALIIDKPPGPTSHDVVARVRKLLKTRTGHTGTLDPLASGVLLLLLGGATRLSRFFQSCDKQYRAEIKLGEVTTTLDREGDVTERKPVPALSRQEIEAILARFTGTIEQLTPFFSAVKVKGKKLYKVARSQDAELRRIHLETRPLRRVSIHELELVACTSDCWTLLVCCSSGTYLRALAHDLGQAVGCGAHLSSLRRTRCGPFTLSQAVPLEQLSSHWQQGFIPLHELLPDLPRLDLSQAQAERISHGTGIPAGAAAPRGLCRLFHGPHLIAIAAAQANEIRPRVVLVRDPTGLKAEGQ